ncbi:MAG TPA: DUF4479 and tRNA-binding domain-containing protein [Alloiococcus sp.]|nr:DUF4479 and tRNA-binding domain-containing protein [Alloiococcus sp.]
MLVASYNRKSLDDILVVMLNQSAQEDQSFKRVGNVVEIKNDDQDEVVGYNFFNISEHLSLDEDGPVQLSKEQVSKLNDLIKESGFKTTLVADPSPKFVVGYVKECKPHEDSDHLNITQTEVDNGEVLQIVCGASNIAQGQKVVVAKPGAVMPDGMVIWPGELRGVKSNGMICSARELNIESDQQKGILVLEETAHTGEAFTF